MRFPALLTFQPLIMELIYIVTIVLSLTILAIFYYLISQWAHEVKSRNHHLNTQSKLLSMIAEKQGVARKDIETLMAKEPEANPVHVNLYIILLLLFVVLAVVIGMQLKQ
jgi:hypothetical protein